MMNSARRACWWNNAGILPAMGRAHEMSDAQYENVRGQPRRRVPDVSGRDPTHDRSRRRPHHQHLLRRRADRRLMFAAYCASKHGVVGLTKALAAELAGDHITVNAVCPVQSSRPWSSTPPEHWRNRAVSLSTKRSAGSWAHTHPGVRHLRAGGGSGAVPGRSRADDPAGVALPVDGGWTA